MKTFFDKNAVPNNLITISDFRMFGKSLGLSWRGALAYWIRVKGGALLLKADGSLVSFTRKATGKFSQKTFKQNQWGWQK